MKIRKSFAWKLKKSYKTKHLAALLGYSPGGVCNILSGRRRPSKRFIERVIVRMGYTLQEIVHYG